MKSRILPIMTIGFGVLFALKTASFSYASTDDVSSETDATHNASANPHSKSDPYMPDPYMPDPYMPDPYMSDTTSENALCLTADLAQALTKQKEELSRRSQRLVTREAGLKALEERVNGKLDFLKDARAEFENSLAKISELADDDITHLVIIYQTMKPKKAAEIFDKMDPAFAAGFLRRMNGTKAGLIMSEINPKTSYRISLIIANQNAAWRSNEDF